MKVNKNATKLGTLFVSSLLSIMIKSTLNKISIAQVKKGEMYL